ncbi:MAG: response regulator [Desulfobacteraceae bacterium]|nr:MAG: response regulator [Desulfobacteraceae bacterium]
MNLSFFQKTLLVLAGISLLGALLSGAANYRSAVTAAKAQVIDRIKGDLRASTEYFDQVYTTRIRSDLASLEAMSSLRQFIALPKESRHLPQADTEQELVRLLDANRRYHSIRFIDDEGIQRIGARKGKRIKGSVSIDQRAKGDDHYLRIAEMFGKLKNEPPQTILFSPPFKDSRKEAVFLAGIGKMDPDIGGFGGAVIISCSLSDYLEQVSAFKMFGKVITWIFDQKGNILYHPLDTDRSPNPLPYVNGGKEPPEDHIILSRSVKLGPQPEDFLVLACSVPPDMVASASGPIIYSTAAVILLTAGFSVLVSFFVARRLAAPVSALARASRVIAGGDFSARVEPGGGGELEMLEHSFNTMADNLEKTTVSMALFREQKERAQMYFDIAGAMLLALDLEGNVAAINNKGCRVLEYESGDIIGRQWFECFLPEKIGGKAKSVFDDVIQGKSHLVEYNEKPVLTKSGEERIIAWHNSLMHGPDRSIKGVFSSGEDITERRRAEEALRRKEVQLQVILEATADGILAVDNRGKVIKANRRFVELWKMPQSIVDAGDDHAMLNHSMGQVIDPEPFIQKIRSLNNTASLDMDTLFFKDGRVFERYSAPLMQEGAVIGRVWSFRDIKERKQAEEQRLAMERNLQQTQKLESLGVLAGGIAHDFNNLLMGLLGHADMALIKLSPVSPVRENLQQIKNISQRAADLCRQMLAYAGRGRFLVESIDLNVLVEEMVHLLKTSISKKAALKLNLHRKLPAIDADAGQIRQVVMNLIINASEAVGEKSGVITVSTGVEECETGSMTQDCLENGLPSGSFVYLEIADTGCGMDKQTVQRIFEPFFTTKFTGRGLGISAVLGIVRMHKGAIKIASEPGEGTRFKVLFPALPIRPEPGGMKEESDRFDWRGSGTILLVDDEAIIRQVSRQLLESLGFSVLTASDGLEALDIYRKKNREIALVLLDMTMPQMDGAETFREMQRHSPDVPVILSSGYTEQDVSSRVSGKDFAGFIQKPYTLKNLRDELRRILKDNTKACR